MKVHSMFNILKYLNIHINSNVNNVIQFSKKYIVYFIGLFLVATFTIVVSTTALVNSHTEYISNQINQNIYEYNEIDLDHLCRLSDCNYVYTLNKTYVNNDILTSTEYINPEEFDNIHHNIFWYDGSFVLYNTASKSYFSIDILYQVKDNIINLSVLYTFFFIAFGYVLYRTYQQERNEALLQNIGNEAILANKSMVMITENVHHELNTPIEVIENKITKIHRTLNNYIISENDWWIDNANLREVPVEKRKRNKKIIKLERDFEFVKIALEQIFSVLSKMKNFKSLRFSNGDKTIYDIIEGAFRIISISNCDYNYTVSDDFKQYRMLTDSLKNVDLLNILINHIKNSIEANATTIDVSTNFNVFTNSLSVQIKDNGTGIPDKHIDDVFKPNLSTKQIGDSIRGNGMYLNKHIINEFGGDINILKTSIEGTTISISFEVQQIEDKTSNHI